MKRGKETDLYWFLRPVICTRLVFLWHLPPLFRLDDTQNPVLSSVSILKGPKRKPGYIGSEPRLLRSFDLCHYPTLVFRGFLRTREVGFGPFPVVPSFEVLLCRNNIGLRWLVRPGLGWVRSFPTHPSDLRTWTVRHYSVEVWGRTYHSLLRFILRNWKWERSTITRGRWGTVTLVHLSDLKVRVGRHYSEEGDGRPHHSLLLTSS